MEGLFPERLLELGLCRNGEVSPETDLAAAVDTQKQHSKTLKMQNNHASSTQRRASALQTARLWGVTLWKVPGQEGRQANR